MNLVRFIENRYQELTLKTQKNKDAFDIVSDSEIKAAHAILNFYRWLLKWALVPKVFFDFFMVKAGRKPEPQPVIMNQMKKDLEAKKSAESDSKITSIKKEKAKTEKSEAPG